MAILRFKDPDTGLWVEPAWLPPDGLSGTPLIKASDADQDAAWGTYGMLQHQLDPPMPVVADPVAFYRPGTTLYSLTAPESTAGSWPCGERTCTVRTDKVHTGTATSQWCLSNSSAVNFVYYRSGNVNGWGPWSTLIDPASVWTTLPLGSGYVAASSKPQYRIKNGVVYYRGQVSPTSGNYVANAAVAIVTALPAAIQPTLLASQYVMTACAVSSGTGIARVYITQSTPAKITAAPGIACTYVDLNGFFYPLG